MEMLFIGLTAAVVLVGFYLQRRMRFAPEVSDRRQHIAYVKNDALLSPAERSFHGVLEQAVGGTYSIHAKVRLADLLSTPVGLSSSQRQVALNRISAKHIDFVLVRPGTTQIAMALELDDSSHQRPDRKRRDAFVEAAMQSAGLTLVRIPVSSTYSVQELRARLGLPAANQSSPSLTPTVASSTRPLVQSLETTPSCPKCAAPMVKRQASRGEHAGKQFWACSRFPTCRAIVSLNSEDAAAKA